MHFDFHAECAKNTDPLLEMVDNFIWPEYINKMGIFKQTNSVILKDEADGLLKLQIVISRIDSI